MAKNYNINNPSDMKRFAKDLQEAGLKEAESLIREKGISDKCPNCHKTILIKPGTVCPHCGALFSSDIKMKP